MNEKCPDCGSGFKAKPFNRDGWFYAECGRRFHVKRKEWEPTPPVGCLRRQIGQLKSGLLLMAKLASDEPEFSNPLIVAEAKRLRDQILLGVE